MWKTNHTNLENCELLCYSRVDGILISDHRPVKALFKVNIKTINKIEKENLQHSLLLKSTELPLDILES